MYYTKARLHRILNLSYNFISKLEKEGIIKPIKQIGKRKYYGFQEYLGLKTIQTLRQNGISPKKLVGSIKLVEKKFNTLNSPLTEIKYIPLGKEVIIKYGNFIMNSQGQYLLPAFFETPKNNIQQMQPNALYWFEEASKYDQQSDTIHLAEEYYKKAIAENPKLIEAYINLGTLYYRIGRIKSAEKYYFKALKIERDNPYLLYNLGNLYDEVNNYKKAIQYYRKAIKIMDDYGDAHYNLALVYIKLKNWKKALQHLKRYLTIDPESVWADIAKKQIEYIEHILNKEESNNN